MTSDEMRRKWQAQSEVAFGELSQWRAEHPQATLAEMEQVIDAKIMALRASVIQEMALTSAAAAGAGSVRSAADHYSDADTRSGPCAPREGRT